MTLMHRAMKNPFAKPSVGAHFGAKMAETARGMASLVFVFMLSTVAIAQVQQPELPPPTPEIAKRIKTLESELRCLVCQNQTLAESPAGLAGDLRREVRTLVEQGKSDAEIKTFLVARYGDFVLYRPPVESKTWLLWYGPFALLFVAAMIAWRVIVRRKRIEVLPGGVPPPSAPSAGPSQARKLLDDEDAK
jgi:cytochrome c-type biogenesis protein CcmH